MLGLTSSRVVMPRSRTVAATWSRPTASEIRTADVLMECEKACSKVTMP